MTEEEAYNIALDELTNRNYASGIWAKAMAFSDGDEKKTKANYLKFRAEQILKSERGYTRATIGIEMASILFSPYGRLPRSIFAIILIVCVFIFILSAVLIDGARYRNEDLVSVLCAPFYLGAAWSLLCAHLKRARDFGQSPFLVSIYIIPLLGWLAIFWYLFEPSVSSNTQHNEA